MSVTDPKQFRLRMLWPGSGAASLRSAGTAVCRAGDGRQAADGRHEAAICPGTLRDPGTGRHRSHSGTPGRDGTGHTPGLRDGTAPVTLRDSETGWHRSHSGTPRRDGTGHTPGSRDRTGPVTLRDPGTGRHRSHSGIPGRDGPGHTPGPRDGTSHTPPGN